LTCGGAEISRRWDSGGIGRRGGGGGEDGSIMAGDRGEGVWIEGAAAGFDSAVLPDSQDESDFSIA